MPEDSWLLCLRAFVLWAFSVLATQETRVSVPRCLPLPSRHNVTSGCFRAVQLYYGKPDCTSYPYASPARSSRATTSPHLASTETSLKVAMYECCEESYKTNIHGRCVGSRGTIFNMTGVLSLSGNPKMALACGEIDTEC